MQTAIIRHSIKINNLLKLDYRLTSKFLTTEQIQSLFIPSMHGVSYMIRSANFSILY